MTERQYRDFTKTTTVHAAPPGVWWLSNVAKWRCLECGEIRDATHDCPPAARSMWSTSPTHEHLYIPYPRFSGDVLYCRGCADVKPLSLPR
jgi:hypothetical protein